MLVVAFCSKPQRFGWPTSCSRSSPMCIDKNLVELRSAATTDQEFFWALKSESNKQRTNPNVQWPMNPSVRHKTSRCHLVYVYNPRNCYWPVQTYVQTYYRWYLSVNHYRYHLRYSSWTKQYHLCLIGVRVHLLVRQLRSNVFVSHECNTYWQRDLLWNSVSADRN